MSVIPWKNKSTETPAGRESPLAEIRTEVNRLFDSFLREPFGGAQRYVFMGSLVTDVGYFPK